MVRNFAELILVPDMYLKKSRPGRVVAPSPAISAPSEDARFRRLFTSHRDAVWSYCYRRLQPDEVPDAVAEVFLVAWRRIEEVPPGDESLLWLYGVARNIVRNVNRSTLRRRRLGVKLASLGQVPEPAPEVQVVQSAGDSELIRAVARLKPLEQELLRLRTWEELSLAEIAQLVDISVRAVDSRLHRIRKKLATTLESSPARNETLRTRPVEEGGER